MFERLFTDGSTIERYRTAPLLDERLRWLGHCADSGARQCTLRSIAGCQLHLVRLLDLQVGDRIGITRVEAAAQQWSLPGVRRFSRHARPDARQWFVGHALRWLRFADMFADEPCLPRHGHADEVAIFANRMRSERGWAKATVRGCCDAVDHFFDGLDDRGITLDSVCIEDIDGQVAYWHARGLGRGTIRCYAKHLRSFFRFAEDRGWCMAGLADGILAPRFHPGETIPKGLNRDEVVRLLATTEGDRPADIRNRAILMLLIAYGLRAGEAAGLRLDDLDWAEERLQVRRPKPGRTHHYPLSRGVGQAILRYVREVRPRRPERALFLTLRAPTRPMTRGAVGDVVRSCACRIGVVGRRRSPHALRHGAAQHLLDHGMSMKEVGDYLGHRGVSATAAYARVQIDTLREVGEIDLEGLA
ncbi:MAG: tyrosine-type recombinase/integrase [Boseongicola sp. SB0662_bin_57]|nr:tyrosine-type recombinase/integrase [Boseongicola sp. SB0662_bin_57]